MVALVADRAAEIVLCTVLCGACRTKLPGGVPVDDRVWGRPGLVAVVLIRAQSATTTPGPHRRSRWNMRHAVVPGPLVEPTRVPGEGKSEATANTIATSQRAASSTPSSAAAEEREHDEHDRALGAGVRRHTDAQPGDLPQPTADRHPPPKEHTVATMSRKVNAVSP